MLTREFAHHGHKGRGLVVPVDPGAVVVKVTSELPVHLRGGGGGGADCGGDGVARAPTCLARARSAGSPVALAIQATPRPISSW